MGQEDGGDDKLYDDAIQDDQYIQDNLYDDLVLSTKFCRVYDKNDLFTLLVQLLLALIALLSLYLKRLFEKPRRTFLTWFLDVFKQGLGACYAHVLNMLIASVISHNIRGDSVLNDQCAWYGLSYLIDTTLGLVLAIFFLYLLDEWSHLLGWTWLQASGVYVGPQAYWIWSAQVGAWLFILTITKLIIYLFMWVFSEPLAWAGQLLFEPLQDNIHFELVFVMILFPGVLNVIYFWIADQYLKAKPEHSAAHEAGTGNDGDSSDSKKEALVDKNDDDDDASQLEQAKQQAATKGSYQPAPWTSFGVEAAQHEVTGV